MSLLVLERGMEGFERGRNLDKLGMHAQDTAELSFTDVKVPVENLLGTEEGKGFVQLVEKLPQERLSIAIAGAAAATLTIVVTPTIIPSSTPAITSGFPALPIPTMWPSLIPISAL